MSVAMQPSAIPQLPGLPILGHLLDVRRDRLSFHQRLGAQLGPIAAFRIGPRRVVMVYDLDYIHTILVDNDAAFEKTRALRSYLRPLLGDGLLSTLQERHRGQRRLVAPAFQHRRIAAYVETMAAVAHHAQARWRDGEQLDLMHEMHQIALEIVGKTLFGVDVQTEGAAISDALVTALHSVDRMIRAFVPLPTTWPTPTNRRLHQAITVFDELIYRIIDQRRASGEDRGDLLSMLLQATDAETGEPMSRSQVRDEAVTLFLAGFETTANALVWAWYLLAQHPQIAARLRAEATTVLGGRPITLDDLPNLPYAMQVFKESMRLYPPAHSIARQPKQDTQLGPYTIPAGTIMGISVYSLHRNPAIFAEPTRFDPDRFTPERERQLPRHSYMPFSDGPRQCIGNHFALMEGQIVLATLAQAVQFELLTTAPVRPLPLITLRPAGPVAVQVRRVGS